MTQNIKNWCKQENITIAGELPFDIQIVNAMVNCKSIIEYAKDSEIAREIEKFITKSADRYYNLQIINDSF